MKQDFWQDKWDAGQIGFHQSDINGHLRTHWASLGLSPCDTVFVPLAGKSKDLLWLREQGHHVIAVEWSQTAVDAFFAENGIRFEQTTERGVMSYRAERLTFYCGDYFALDAEHLDGIRGVFDRAALIALPPETRVRYAAHMRERVQAGAQVLLVTLEYAAGVLPGPPFSVSVDEVMSHYAGDATVDVLLSESASGPRDIPVTQHVFRVSPQS